MNKDILYDGEVIQIKLENWEPQRTIHYEEFNFHYK